MKSLFLLNAPNRLPALDGLRAIAALSVFGAHLHQYGRWDVPVADPWLAYAGQGGVMLFFALSGFLLYLPWARHKPVDVGVYATRRVLRIIPAYYVCVVVIVVLEGGIGGRDLLLHLVFLPLFSSVALLSVFWSLQVEWFFYAILPGISKIYRSDTTLLAMCAVLSMAWAAMVLTLLPERHWTTAFTQTPFYLFAFACGIVASTRWVRGFNPPWLIPIGVAGYLVLSQIVVRIDSDIPAVPFANLLLAPFAAMLVLGIAHRGPAVLRSLPMRIVGAISYSLYLWHLYLIKNLPLELAAALALPVAVASFLLVERPFLLKAPRRRGELVPATSSPAP